MAGDGGIEDSGFKLHPPTNNLEDGAAETRFLTCRERCAGGGVRNWAGPCKCLWAEEVGPSNNAYDLFPS